MSGHVGTSQGPQIHLSSGGEVLRVKG